jgi:hypothetical protein
MRAQLEGCGEYWMLRLRVDWWQIQSFEVVAPTCVSYAPIIWLRCASLSCVLTNTSSIEPRKHSSFHGRWVGLSLTSPIVIYTGIVYGPPTDSPVWGIVWKTYTRERCDPTRLLYHCRECGHSYCLYGSRVSCCQVIFIGMWIDSSLRKTLGYGWYLLVAIIP